MNLPVSSAGLALIVLAVVLYAAEVKLVSYGVLTLGGTISLILGALLIFDGPSLDLRIGLPMLVALGILAVSLVGFLTRRALAVRRLPVRSGWEGMVHERGRACSLFSGRGKVFVHGEYWDAFSAQPVKAGEEVEVIAIEELRLVVRPLHAA